MIPTYASTYNDYPYHPWKDRDGNYIMSWLNYWSTSEFLIVKSSNMGVEMNKLANGEMNLVPVTEGEGTYNVFKPK
ncbi:MAG TPA: hypothetical protein DEQ24_02990 [Enterococcus sp.]|nr:hypothetical protein [Enterococcus sp.]